MPMRKTARIHCEVTAHLWRLIAILLRWLKARAIGPFVAARVCALLLALAGPPLLRGRLAFRPFPLRRPRRFAHVRDPCWLLKMPPSATLCRSRRLRNSYLIDIVIVFYSFHPNHACSGTNAR